MRTCDIEALRSAGVDPATIARALEFSPLKTRVKITGGACPACGSKAMPGDFVCGTCSEVYMDRPRRFWQYVYERMIGKVGRAIYPKPGPQQLPAQTPSPKKERAYVSSIPFDLAPAPQREPERREFLICVGPVGRVVVATCSADAVRVAHRLNGDIATAGHTILDMGPTLEAETEIEPAKVEAKTVKLVDHVFRIEGPGYVREMKLATVASSDRS
jgi:hypothetical protein